MQHKSLTQCSRTSSFSAMCLLPQYSLVSYIMHQPGRSEVTFSVIHCRAKTQRRWRNPVLLYVVLLLGFSHGVWPMQGRLGPWRVVERTSQRGAHVSCSSLFMKMERTIVMCVVSVWGSIGKAYGSSTYLRGILLYVDLTPHSRH